MEMKIDSKDIQDIINTQIQLAIAKELGRDPEAVMINIVSRAMSEKKSSYDKETIFGTQVNKMIREAAQSAMSEWIEGKRPEIEKAVVAQMNKGGGKMVKNFATRFVEALGDSYRFRG